MCAAPEDCTPRDFAHRYQVMNAHIHAKMRMHVEMCLACEKPHACKNAHVYACSRTHVPCVSLHLDARVCVYRHEHAHAYNIYRLNVRVCMNTWQLENMYICMYVYMYVCVCVCIYIYIYIYIQAYGPGYIPLRLQGLDMHYL